MSPVDSIIEQLDLSLRVVRMPHMLDPPDCLFDESLAVLQCKSLASITNAR